MHFHTSITFFIFLTTLSALALTPTESTMPEKTGSLLPVHVIQEFPKRTWLENIAIRPNGQILVTVATAAQVVLVDPLKRSPPIVVYTFPGVIGAYGIAETSNDVFHVIVGNFSVFTRVSIPGSYSAWRIDMTTFSLEQDHPATVHKIGGLPGTGFLNGMTTASGSIGGDLLLISDSQYGVVRSFNIHSGKQEIVIDDPLMKPIANALNIGVNGVHVLDGTLYFTNSDYSLFCSVEISPDGRAKGPAEIVAINVPPDDFAIDAKKKSVYIAENSANELAVVKLNVVSLMGVVIAGMQGSLELAGPSACAFGRMDSDKNSLYLSTTGGVLAYETNNFTVGGTVSRVDLS